MITPDFRERELAPAPGPTSVGSDVSRPAVAKENIPEGNTPNRIVASIVLPAYNEALALPSVLSSIFAVIDSTCEVIVVDDGSSDDTSAIARAYPCRLIRHETNAGKGAAVQTAVDAARGESVIIMDADNTYPADAIPLMITLLEDYDWVRGVRNRDAENMPTVNRLGNSVFDTLLRLVHGLEGGDHLTGLYGLRRSALEYINFTATGFDLEVEIGIKARAHDLRSISFPIEYRPRLGEKKLQAWRDGWRILRRVLGMALLYNPVLSFVAPGLVLWTLTVFLGLGLHYGAALSPTLALDNFVIVAVGMATSIGFQLIVFAVVTALYSAQRGVKPAPWLLRLSTPRARSAIAGLGISSALVGLGTLSVFMIDWLFDTRWVLEPSRVLALGGGLLFLGLQMILAVLFISIFAEPAEAASRSNRHPSQPPSSRVFVE
ncbi:MAG: glycosyltransferase family 2 protein [Anaerolineae bacterium]